MSYRFPVGDLYTHGKVVGILDLKAGDIKLNIQYMKSIDFLIYQQTWKEV